MSTTQAQPRFRQFRIVLNCAVALILAGLVFIQLGDVVTPRPQKDLKLQFFDDDVTVPLTREHLPEQLGDWTLRDYHQQERTHNSDLGQRSDVWQYDSSHGPVTVSFDQTFPGWHELTECYCNTGWTYETRTRVDAIIESTGEHWPYVELDLVNPLGEHGFVVFSHFDVEGHPFDAPSEWGGLEFLALRAQNRMSHTARRRFFSGEAYQTQAFIASGGEISESAKQDVRDRYFTVREQFRTMFATGTGNHNVAQAAGDG